MALPEGKTVNGLQRWLSKRLVSIGNKGKLDTGQEGNYAIYNTVPPTKHSKVPATIPNVDDCISFETLSDQATQQHRNEEQTCPSHALDAGSWPSSIAVASAHMAALHSLLASHMNDIKDGCTAQGQHTSRHVPAARSNVQEQQQATSQTSVCSMPNISQSTATVAADTAILQPSAANDEKEAHPLPDQAQLLDLVQTLIADHRYSLLERQRLQQQLEATQQALQVVKLDKDKAIVLADLRSEEASQAKAHLADAAAAAQRLHSLQAITANNICLPPPPPAANGGRARTESSPIRAALNTQTSGPLEAGALAGQLSKLIRSNVTTQQSQVQHAARQGHMCSEGSRMKRWLRSCSGQNHNPGATVASVNDAASKKQQSPERKQQQQPLPKTADNGFSETQSISALNRAGHEQLQEQLQQQQQDDKEEEHLSWVQHSQQRTDEAYNGVAYTTMARQQQRQRQEQQDKEDMVGLHSTCTTSAASKVALNKAGVLEQVLMQRLLHSQALPAHALHSSIETEASSQSSLRVNVDITAAATGLTKPQVQQLVQKPWRTPACPQLQQPVLPRQHPRVQNQLQAAAGAGRAADPAQKELHIAYESAPVMTIDTAVSAKRQQPASQSSDSDSCAASLIKAGHMDHEHDSNSVEDGGSSSSSSGSHVVTECHRYWSGEAKAAHADLASLPPAAPDGARAVMDPAAPAARPAGLGSGLVQRLDSPVPNTNNNSWPELKTSQHALRNSALLAALQPPADQPAPGAYRRPNQRLRPRTQHLQRPVSSVDSAIAPPVSGMAVIETAVAERPAAERTTSMCNTGNSTVAWAVPAEADGQQGAEPGPSAGVSRQQHRFWDVGQHLAARPSTAQVTQTCLPQGPEQVEQHPGHMAFPQHGHKQTGQRQCIARSTAAAAAAAPGNGAAGGSKDPEDALSDEVQAMCMETTPRATGCTSLRPLVAIGSDQTIQQAQPRPGIVPRLDLCGRLQCLAQRQQVQGSSRLALGDQEGDLAPLKAQPGSARSRRPSRASTPGSTCHCEPAAGSASLQAARSPAITGAAHTAEGASVPADTPDTLSPPDRLQQLLSCSGRHAVIADKSCLGPVGSAGPSSSSGSGSGSKRCSAVDDGASAAEPAATAAANCGKVTSAGGVDCPAGAAITAGSSSCVYWGSTAGSYPASAASTSRQHTPTAELSAVAAASTAGGAAVPSRESSGLSTIARAATVTSVRPATPLLSSATAGQAAAALGEPIAAANGLDATTGVRAGGALGFMRLNSRAAAAAAAGTYMRMRPSHLYRSISTVYAMYSPLRGGLRALGHSRTPPPGECQANAAFVHFHEETGCCPLLVSHTTGIAAAAIGHAEDVRLQELLSGCSTVPEEGVLLDQPVDEQLVRHCCPALFTTAACEAQKTGTAVQLCAAAADDAEVAGAVQDASFVAEYQMAYLHQELYLPQQLAAVIEQQQEEQEKDVVQRGPVFAPAAPAPVHASGIWPLAQRAGGSSNVVRTTSCSNPSPGMGNRTGLASAARQHASMPSHGGLLQAAGLACSTLTIPDIQVNSAGGVGPLTALSPTRWRPGSTTTDRRSSASAATTMQQCSSLQPLRQHQVVQQLTGTASSRAAAAAAAKVEAEADAIAARVAAAAASLNQPSNRQGRHHEAVHNSSCLQQQRYRGAGDLHQLQHEDWHRRHGEDGWLQMQSQSGASSPMPLPQQQQQQQQEALVPWTQSSQTQKHGSGGCSNIPQHIYVHDAANNDKKCYVGGGRAAASAGQEQGTDGCSEDYVATYHNPMTALEDAGFHSADDAMLVKAGLVPGFSSWQLAAAAAAEQQLAQGSPCRVLSNACNSSIELLRQPCVTGVDAASVPANMTPLGQCRRHRSSTAATSEYGTTPSPATGEARELLCRSLANSSPGSVVGEGALSIEGQAGTMVVSEDSISSDSTAHGRLHWNPLYAVTVPADAQCT